MQPYRSPFSNIFCFKIPFQRNQIKPIPKTPSCDVFINHRGIDTKKNICGLLHDRLTSRNVDSFLDKRCMKPGEKLLEKIDTAINDCKVAMVVFSPHYCDSYFCLYELDLIMKLKKRIVPIFCDVKPSELCVIDDGKFQPKELERIRQVVNEARWIVGLTFDSSNGDWSEFIKSATDAVVANLLEVEREECTNKNQLYFTFNDDMN